MSPFEMQLGLTPLYWAVNGSWGACIALLLAGGADPLIGMQDLVSTTEHATVCHSPQLVVHKHPNA